MDATILVAEFVRELELLEKISSKKPTIPYYAHVLLKATQEDGMRLAATDSHVGLLTFAPAAVTVPGATTANAKSLLDMVRLLSDTSVRITTDPNGSARVTSGNYTSRLQTLPAPDYPRFESSTKGLLEVKLPQADFRAMIARVQFAVSDTDKRYFMNGAFLVLNDTGFALVTTDGHRLALATCPLSGLTPDSVVIPVGTLTKLFELLSGTGDMLFYKGPKHLLFVIDGRMLISRMIEAKYPAWERIVPRGNTRVIFQLPRLATIASVRRVLITAGESSTVKWKLFNGELAMSTRSAEIGDADESTPVAYDGEEFLVGLNGNYLLNFLDAAAGEFITFEQKTRDGALLLTDGANYTYVLMPIRV